MIHYIKYFSHGPKGGSIYMISDTHFGDSDCKLMDKNWVLPDVKNIQYSQNDNRFQRIGCCQSICVIEFLYVFRYNENQTGK